MNFVMFTTVMQQSKILAYKKVLGSDIIAKKTLSKLKHGCRRVVRVPIKSTIAIVSVDFIILYLPRNVMTFKNFNE